MGPISHCDPPKPRSDAGREGGPCVRALRSGRERVRRPRGHLCQHLLHSRSTRSAAPGLWKRVDGRWEGVTFYVERKCALL